MCTCLCLCTHSWLCAFTSALHHLVYCMRVMEGVHVSACVCVNVHSLYLSMSDIWRFAPKANKSVMPGIRPWPLLKLHRQAERLINQTASHRCDGFHTNRQQTVKVTSNRVNCQPGRQAGSQAGRTFLSLSSLPPYLCLYLYCSLPLSLSLFLSFPPLLYLSLGLPSPLLTSSVMPRCDTSEIFVLSL